MVSQSINSNSFKNSIFLKEIIHFLFYTGLIATFFFSIYNVYNTYRESEKLIINEVSALEKALEPELLYAMWDFNKISIQRTLKAFVQNPNIAKVQIFGFDINTHETAADLKNNWITLNFPLIISQKTPRQHTGILKIFLHREHFTNDFKLKVLKILLQNFIFFIILANCLIFIFNKKISYYDNQSHAETESIGEKENKTITNHLETIGISTVKIAHDFSNILTIITNATQVLKRNIDEKNDLKKIEDIQRATTRALLLVKKIITVTMNDKKAAVFFDPAKNLFEINELLNITVGSSVALTICATGNESFVFGDPHDFENIILNMCANSRDAMSKGGNIKIAIESINKNDIEYIAISVKDTGHGIPDEIKKNIFEPYFTTKDVDKGTGLGLSQVKSFVKDSDGMLEFFSDEKGTCFKILLPKMSAGIQLSA